MRSARLRVRIKGEGNCVMLVQPADCQSYLVDHAKEIAEGMGGDLDGHIIIGWNKEGGFLVGYRFGKIPPRYGAALAKEIISSEVSAMQAVYGSHEDDQ